MNAASASSTRYSSKIDGVINGATVLGSDDHETESALAQRVADNLQHYLSFDDTSNQWFAADGGIWLPVSERMASRMILRVLNAYLPQGFGIHRLNNVKQFLGIFLLVEEWEKRRHLLPVQNGVLDTAKMVLHQYAREYRFTWQLPYAYEPSATCPVILAWLRDATGGDDEAINVIRAFFRMALIGGETQKFLELIGPGGTGKSTLIRLLVALVGKNNQISTDLKNLESNRFEVAGLYGKKLAVINDSSRYGGEVSVLKALTGGDPVRHERKNQQQSGSFVFDGVVVVASNEAIQTSDYTSGLIRRRMPVSFNRKVTDADKERWASHGGIETAMLAELPGLLNWALSMPDAEVKKAIGGINGAMTRTQRHHLVETNRLAAWLDDNCVLEQSHIAHLGSASSDPWDHDDKLYTNYAQWCRSSGYTPIAVNRFVSNLIDVCQQLKLEVKELPRDAAGKRVQGLAIRSDRHSTIPTPVTNTVLDPGTTASGADESAFDADAVLMQVIDSVKDADHADEMITEDFEVF